MWKAIKQAKKKVWLETYILEPDTVGKATMNLLIEAKNRGCDVKVLYDDLGSVHLKRKHIKAMKKAGIEVNSFNPLFRWPFRIHNHFGMFRDHRKLLIIDDDKAFCGGMNIGSEYAGYQVGGTRFYRDTHMQIWGPAAIILQQVFASSMKDTCLSFPRIKIPDSFRRMMNSIEDAEDNAELRNFFGTSGSKKLLQSSSFLQILASNPSRNIHNIQRAFISTLKNCKQKIFITSPYFVPPPKLMQALIDASRRGIEVRILTSRLSEVFGIKPASQYVYDKLLNENIRIYEYFVGNIHAKTATADDCWSMIGSFNMDPVSFHHNLELGVVMFDPKFAQQLERDFDQDLKGAREITRKEFNLRSTPLRTLWHWLHYILMTKIMF
eukprot:TRINITY_DN1623_c0_g1_i2.p1 TRINITY_DN1623_c0_g1~~TRINITY_DN1623_c0_g1_i2.p1  ORF type:complete len:381 (-),score=46.41 TRINITY_DN1623_c0_g1_i2:93-1235(-)